MSICRFVAAAFLSSLALLPVAAQPGEQMDASAVL